MATTSEAPAAQENVINIGTRKSALAVAQTHLVIGMLQKVAPQYEYRINAISTMGDKNQVTALHDFGAKSLWTHELEAMLMEKEVDFVVHCLKDIPTQLPPTTELGAILRREDPRDAFILSSRHPPNTTLRTLPPNSNIGTSSVRRTAQLARQYPHLRFQSVRGNIGTRLAKLDAEDSPYDGIVLAAAGLIRMGWSDRISSFLSSRSVDTEGAAQDHTEVAEAPPAPHAHLRAEQGAGKDTLKTDEDPTWGMLHAVGQGALALETRLGDEKILELLRPLHDRESALACLAERSLMRTLEGGCSVPIGVETSWGDAPDEVDLTFKAIVVSVDGKRIATGQITKRIDTEEESDEFGREMARLLLDRGAGPILKDINLDRDILEKQAGNA